MSSGTMRCLAGAALLVLTLGSLHGDPTLPVEVALGPGPERVAKLIEQLGADRFRLREQATRELIALGRSALPLVEQATASRDAEVASRAQRIAMEIRNSVPYLLEILKAPDAKTRLEGAAGLERLGLDAQEALPALVAALKDDDEIVREAIITAVVAIEPLHPAIADHVPVRAHAEGKYAKLLRRLRAPQDKQSYTEFRDYGYYQACDWNGFTNIPAGYWVYVYPYWYVWGEQAPKSD
ncbi:hypothetical protein AYO44_07980 [Planctomycetaceae bacterium SCGC AG-212-F19]|nr:hypothetical protein AYO44_07980 [Planctomycetaceae bacterium SCGC AG-212-F19]